MKTKKDNLKSLKTLLEIKEREEENVAKLLSEKLKRELSLKEEFEKVKAQVEKQKKLLNDIKYKRFLEIKNLSKGIVLEQWLNYEKGERIKLERLYERLKKAKEELEKAKRETESAREALKKAANERKAVEKLIEKREFEIKKELEKKQEIEGEDLINVKFSFKK